MASKSIVKNREYNEVRLSIVGTSSGSSDIFYTEASGYRYFYNQITATSSAMEAVSFNAYISLTSSNTATYSFTLIPMDYGESVMLETKVVGFNGSKGFMMNSFGGFKHIGNTLSTIGNIKYDYCSDFTGGATAYFTKTGTSSVNLVIGGESNAGTIDWDIHIKYTKGYHTGFAPGSGGGVPPGPWYPPPQNIS